MQRSGVLVFLAVIAALAALAVTMQKKQPHIASAQVTNQPTEEAETATESAQETPQGEAAIGGTFSLVDTAGTVVTQEALLGKHALVFFGFTSCPDICPTSLLTMTQAIESMGTEGEKVLPVFITVDPERDTPEVMKAYVASFHPRFLALTGTREQTEAAAKAYKVFHQQNQQDEGGYMIDHSGFIYLMSPEGKYLTHFSSSDSAEAMMAETLKYVR